MAWASPVKAGLAELVSVVLQAAPVPVQGAMVVKLVPPFVENAPKRPMFDGL